MANGGKGVNKDRKVTWTHNILLLLVLLALLAAIGLLYYRDYYLKKNPVEIRYVNSVTQETDSISLREANKKFDFLAVEFSAETDTVRIKQIFEELGLDTKISGEDQYTLAFPDKEGYENWYKIKIPKDKTQQELTEILQKYSEVNFVNPISEE